MLAVLAAVTPSAGAGGSRDRCAVTGSKTEKSNAQTRVYTVQRRRAAIYYACLRSTGRRVRLEDEIEEPDGISGTSVTEVQLAGTSVLLRSSSFEDLGPEGAESARLVVADVRRGGRSYSVHINTNAEDLYSGFTGAILRPDGSAAWITSGTGEYDEIDVLAPRAELPRPVAYAKGIDEKSLRFGGDGVTWRQNGETRTAAIR